MLKTQEEPKTNWFVSLLKMIGKRWAYIVYLIFAWVIPILLLDRKFPTTIKAFYDEQMDVGVALTGVGVAVLVVLFFAFKGKLKELAHKLDRGLTRGLLLALFRIITWSIFYCVFLYIQKWLVLFAAMMKDFFNWWEMSGVFILIGLAFLVLDEHFMHGSDYDRLARELKKRGL